jgi:hypothetical protein
LWKTFLKVVAETDSDSASEFADGYGAAFRWYVAGCVQRLSSEYERLPHALVCVEVSINKAERSRVVGIRRDGKRLELLPDETPESPLMLRAGTTVHAWIAPQDLMRMQQMGHKRFLAAIKSGKLRLSPRPKELVAEDTLLNVAPPTVDDLVEIRRDLAGFFRLLRRRRARLARVT